MDEAVVTRRGIRESGLLLAFLRRLLVSALILLIAGFAATALVQLAPGFGVDERALDVAYGTEETQAPSSTRSVFATYTAFLSSALTGDLGESASFGQPVSALIAERTNVTVRSALAGYSVAWVLAIAVCVAGCLDYGKWLGTAGEGTAAALMCIPSAVVAFGAVALGLSVNAGIAIVVFPRVFRYCNELLTHAMTEPFVLSARSRGVAQFRVVLNHGLRHVGPQLVTLLGVTLTLAFGAAIPLEVLCDSAGLGQLAWRGALARDLPVVVTVSLLIAGLTLVSNTAARCTADYMSRKSL